MSRVLIEALARSGAFLYRNITILFADLDLLFSSQLEQVIFALSVIRKFVFFRALLDDSQLSRHYHLHNQQTHHMPKMEIHSPFPQVN